MTPKQLTETEVERIYEFAKAWRDAASMQSAEEASNGSVQLRMQLDERTRDAHCDFMTYLGNFLPKVTHNERGGSWH